MRLLRSRNYVMGFAFIAAAAFLLEAALDHVAAAFAAPVVVGLVIVVIAYFAARRHAAYDFFAAFAYSRGYAHSGGLELVDTTPLLGAGDRRRCEHYMEGPLGPELPHLYAGLALYLFETRSEQRVRRSRIIESWTPHRFTVCVVQLDELEAHAVPEFYLAQRRGVFDRFGLAPEPWLDYERLHEVDALGSRLAGRFQILAPDTGRDARLAELFDHATQTWLSDLPIDLCFEFANGTLVAYTPRVLTEVEALDSLIRATAALTWRIIQGGRPLDQKTVGAPSPQARPNHPSTPD